MKTQISTLRSGRKNQVLNPSVDYTELPQSTSHIGHSGSNMEDVHSVWNKIKLENPEKMTIEIFGEKLELTANWSLSGKSVSYDSVITTEFLENNFLIQKAMNRKPYISIQDGNLITVGNGKNSYRYVCPSLITIL